MSTALFYSPHTNNLMRNRLLITIFIDVTKDRIHKMSQDNSKKNSKASDHKDRM